MAMKKAKERIVKSFSGSGKKYTEIMEIIERR